MDGGRRDHDLEYVQQMSSRRGWTRCATNCQALIRSEPDFVAAASFQSQSQGAHGDTSAWIIKLSGA